MLERVKEKSRERVSKWRRYQLVLQKKNGGREEAKNIFEKIDLQELLTLRNN